MKKTNSTKLRLQKIRIAKLNQLTASQGRPAPTTTVILSVRNLC
jgi:hypothetical protein